MTNKNNYDDTIWPMQVLAGFAVVIVACVALLGLVASLASNQESNQGGVGASNAIPANMVSANASVSGKDVFVNGNPQTGAASCGSCHTLRAAQTTATVGPNLDEMLKQDDAKGILEMIVSPNIEIVEGYQKGVMPANYSKTLSPKEMAALVKFVDQSVHAKR